MVKNLTTILNGWAFSFLKIMYSHHHYYYYHYYYYFEWTEFVLLSEAHIGLDLWEAEKTSCK
jgi:hypothetical protein